VIADVLDEAGLRLAASPPPSTPTAHLAVYATRDDESAQFGELSAPSFKARGVAGVVLDGGCRDVDFIVREDFRTTAMGSSDAAL
jgi:regulator of RNase E activity RraA